MAKDLIQRVVVKYVHSRTYGLGWTSLQVYYVRKVEDGFQDFYFDFLLNHLSMVGKVFLVNVPIVVQRFASSELIYSEPRSATKYTGGPNLVVQ